MAIFIANENGDWWRFETKRSLFVLDTDDLPEEIAKEWGYLDEDGNPSDEGDWADESLIWEYGREVPQDIVVDYYKP
jgi:hypothetical protein